MKIIFTWEKSILIEDNIPKSTKPWKDCYCLQKKIKMTLYSNFSKVVCVRDQTLFRSRPDQTISIISPDEDAIITTSNLKYPLHEEKLPQFSQGLSNVTIGNSFSVQASDWVWVFKNY